MEATQPILAVAPKAIPVRLSDPWRRALWSLIALTAAGRLAIAATLGPGHDEAYYYLYTLHPAWSYHDHPPMVALVEGLGLALTGGGASTLGLRLGFVLTFAASTWLLARITSRWYGRQAGFLAALALNATGFFGLAVGTFAVPDGPLLLFWILTLGTLFEAIERPERLRGWMAVGLAWAGALLTKYHAVFLPVGAVLYLAAEPRARAVLRRPGPYLALAIGMLAVLPVVFWNQAHGWASFAFQAKRAAGGHLRFDTLAAALGGQVLYLFPWMWLGLVAVLVATLRRWRHSDRFARFLVCQAVVPLIAFVAVACRREVLPHWSLIGFVALFPLLGRSWARRRDANPKPVARRLTWAVAAPWIVAAVAVVHERTGILPIPPKQDPTRETAVWRSIADELRRRGLTGNADQPLVSSLWFQSGQLAFALGGETPVLCYHPHDARGFAWWSEPAEWVGKDAILVALDRRSIEPGYLEKWYRRIEPLGAFTVERGGRPLREVRLFRCVAQTRPFPFRPG